MNYDIAISDTDSGEKKIVVNLYGGEIKLTYFARNNTISSIKKIRLRRDIEDALRLEMHKKLRNESI